MSMEDVLDRLKSDAEELKKWVGVYIGVLAVLLAVCNVGGANAAKDATRANIEASNIWAFFQAKNLRRTVYTVAADDLEAMLATQQGLAGAARKVVEDKIAVCCSSPDVDVCFACHVVGHAGDLLCMRHLVNCDYNVNTRRKSSRRTSTRREISTRSPPYPSNGSATARV